MPEIKETANGIDIHMCSICGCEKCTKGWYLSDCEERCDEYYICDNVAMANDIIVNYEDNNL